MSTLLSPLMALEEFVLERLHDAGLAWGLAIVVLTLMVRLALVPLALRKGRPLRLRGALAVFGIQVLIVLSLAALLYGDAAAGTFADAGWLFISDLSQPLTGTALALLVTAYVSLQLVRLRLVAGTGRRRVAIALLAPLPFLLAATQVPAGVVIYIVVSVAFGIAQRLALRAPAPAVA